MQNASVGAAVSSAVGRGVVDGGDDGVSMSETHATKPSAWTYLPISRLLRSPTSSAVSRRHSRTSVRFTRAASFVRLRPKATMPATRGVDMDVPDMAE